MATTIIKGTDFVLQIDGDDYGAQASSVTLTRVVDRQTYNVLDGQVYKTLQNTAELSVEMFADWGAAGSLCEALWNATDTAPDTTIPFSFSANGVVYTGDIYPNFPEISGTSPDAATVTVVLTVDQGIVNV
jgi:hypothetical protein